MTGGEIISALAVASAFAAMLRYPVHARRRRPCRQGKAVESGAREAVRPFRPHCTAAPMSCPVAPLSVDEILAGYADGSIDIHPRLDGIWEPEEFHRWSAEDVERVSDVINSRGEGA